MKAPRSKSEARSTTEDLNATFGLWPMTKSYCQYFQKQGTNQMLAQQHQGLTEKIWAVADKLRGPYRPPQYRRVMLPMIVLRRLDCVLEPTKDEVLKQFDALKKKGLSDAAVEKALAKVASKDRHQPLYNVSPYIFTKLLGDANGLAKNLTAYIKGFSPKVRDVFENLIRGFNEQANEEAGDHFTPREVIRLMAHLIYTGDEDIYEPGVTCARSRCWHLVRCTTLANASP